MRASGLRYCIKPLRREYPGVPDLATAAAKRAVEDALIRVKREHQVLDDKACRFALARYVVEAARDGERDVGKLAQDALFKFRL